MLASSSRIWVWISFNSTNFFFVCKIKRCPFFRALITTLLLVFPAWAVYITDDFNDVSRWQRNWHEMAS